MGFAAPDGLQDALVNDGPERFFVPPYVCHRRWVGLRLDLPETDWEEASGWIEDAYDLVTGGDARPEGLSFNDGA